MVLDAVWFLRYSKRVARTEEGSTDRLCERIAWVVKQMPTENLILQMMTQNVGGDRKRTRESEGRVKKEKIP